MNRFERTSSSIITINSGASKPVVLSVSFVHPVYIYYEKRFSFAIKTADETFTSSYPNEILPEVLYLGSV